MGAQYRTPSDEDFEELVENCTAQWTTLLGASGFLLISNINGNSIFLPACGSYVGTDLLNKNANGSYWTNTYVNESQAKGFRFEVSLIDPIDNINRRVGRSVRAVLVPTI